MRLLFLLLLSTAIGQVEFNSSNLPIVIIHTNDQRIPMDNPRIVVDMGTIDNGAGQRNRITDSPNDYQGKISIEIRGSSTAGWLKKSFAIETQNEDGSNRNVSLLGLPVENDWILYAPYYDHSFIRNVLIYTLSRQMGRYASRTRFCELMLDDEYQGLYVLMEKIKRDNDRININMLNPDENSGEDVTGGYIIKIDKPGDDYFTSVYEPYRGAAPDQDIQYQYHYPKDDEITPEQKTYISTYIYDFEDEMAKARYSNVKPDYPKYIDLDSFVDHFILNEISKNVDGYRLSAFFYKDKNSRLFAGPIWDFNFSFGNIGYNNAWDYENWQLDDYLQYGRDERWLPPFWWHILKEDSSFIFALSTRWRQLRPDILNPDRVDAYIETLVDTLAEARERNFEIWYEPGESRPRNERGWFPPPSPVMDVTNYQEEIDFLKNWYRSRIQWMDSMIPNPPGYHYSGDAVQPMAFILYGNYPNPFNGKTNIEFYVPESGHLRIVVYNILGKPVVQLADKSFQTGRQFLTWDGNDIRKNKVASGVYLVVAQYHDKQYAHKLIYLK
jgi:hypothetical protein